MQAISVHNRDELDQLLAFALNASQEAGKITLEHFQQGSEVDYKSDESPVTIADRAAEFHLRKLIRSQFPSHGIFGEEHGQEGNQSERWVIDPIDGTKSFVCGVPLYAVLLSFEQDGIPMVGVSHFPALQETVYASKGHGAYWNDHVCRVSSRSNLHRATLCTGSHKSLANYGRLEGLVHLSQQVQATRTWCDAYGHCLVATGRVEAMIDPVVAHYDLSAVSLIVTEAGGMFTDFQGQPGISQEAISSNGILHEKILEAFIS